jgi:hypothetical protein
MERNLHSKLYSKNKFMKKTMILLAAFMTIAWAATAQTYNLVLFSEDGENFYAFINGVKQNEKPLSNVKITGLNSEALNVRVEFENKALPKLKQNMMPESGFEHTVRIKKSMKGELKMQYFGKVAIADAPKNGASEVAYHTSDNSSQSPYNTSSGNNDSFNNSTNVNATDNGGGYTTVTTTSTTTQVNGEPENVYLNMGVNGINVNVNAGTGANGTVKSSTTKTVTSTTSTSYNSATSPNTGPKNTQAQTQTQSATAYKGCASAMPEASYAKMKKSVEDKPFSDTKMSTAKLATKNNCLSVAQVKGICALFSMDEDKLTYAKYAYDYSMEKGNYYQVAEIFSFSSTTDEFNKFLEAK